MRKAEDRLPADPLTLSSVLGILHYYLVHSPQKRITYQARHLYYDDISGEAGTIPRLAAKRAPAYKAQPHCDSISKELRFLDRHW